MGVGTSKVLKKKTMMEITRMEVEEVNASAKRKTQAPLEEIMENAEVRKRPKLEAEVVAFGKLLVLSRAWEPSDIWHSPKNGFRGRSHLGFPHGNKV